VYSGAVLHRGSRGFDVARVQRWLNLVRTMEAERPTPAAELMDPNGHFSSQTTRRVREFQQSRGLVVDGRVGPQTWRALCWAARK
jgi:peptidoglycan hydrolase-like protein with peptidoglycan-binding domain